MIAFTRAQLHRLIFLLANGQQEQVRATLEAALANYDAASAPIYFRSLPNHTTAEWCPIKRAFAVRCNGEAIEWFPTYAEAAHFANRHDQLAEVRDEGKARTA